LIETEIPGLRNHQADDLDFTPVPGRWGGGNACGIDLGYAISWLRVRGAGGDEERGDSRIGSVSLDILHALLRSVEQRCVGGAKVFEWLLRARFSI
jgi:hypothetical protein